MLSRLDWFVMAGGSLEVLNLENEPCGTRNALSCVDTGNYQGFTTFRCGHRNILVHQ